MTTRTRYFVIASLLVLTVGLGTGLVAYYVGFPMSAFQRAGGPEELRYMPRDAAVVAYADVREVMTSQLRQRVHDAIPTPENGQQEFENQTGINIERDIDRVVACAQAAPDGSGVKGGGMVLARGRFDEVKIESLMRSHGAEAESYKGSRLIETYGPHQHQADHDTKFAVAFMEPGLVAVGTADLVRTAIDIHAGGNLPNATANEDLMTMIRSLDTGNNAWAVGRFDALRQQARLPEQVASQIPPITWFSVASHVNGGIRGIIRAETRDDESANNLRDVVRGFMAMAKLGAGSKPEMQTMLQSLELGGTGKTVALSFAVPVEVLDVISKGKRGH